MVEYYKKEEFEKLKAQRKKTFIFFFVILGVYALISAAFFWWYLTLPYKSPQIVWVKVGHYTVTGLMAIFSYIFIGIKLKRMKKYYRMLSHIETGLREESTASFIENDERVFLSLGVEMKWMVFLQWNKYKEDYYERKVMIPADKPFPDFKEGQMIRFITQGNILVSYEILD
ncbi:MAG: hypothetical protein E7382_04545 [Clostridiales bacterium]|nr:hypothetical protein [Clostridiales bacterium]